MTKLRGFEVISKYKEFDIKLPERSTKNSAGYDFFAIEDITIPSFITSTLRNINLESIDGCSRGLETPFCIKTGIKAYMQDNEVLQLYIRSSSPSKLGLILANSVGIVDSDYYNNPDNEGEIGFLVYNISLNDVKIKKGDKIGQGIFTSYNLADNDNTINQRIGGFGSTGQ